MILLHEPTLKGSEIKYLSKCIKTNWVSTSGKFLNILEKKICEFTKSKYAILVNSGTSALHISLLLSNTKPGHEVIVPTVSFIAPINAIKYCNASPVFMDVDDYLNIDIKKTISFLENETIIKNNLTYNKRTKKRISAIIVVHVFGNLVDINPLIKICKKRNIDLIEDGAESFGSYYNNYKKKKHAGTIGKFGCLSFNGNKIITCGGGGAILTQNKKLAYKARYLVTQAKNDSVYFVHDNVGYNYKMTNLHAAVGTAQINKIKKILVNKKKIFDFYCKQSNSIRGVSMIKSPNYCVSNNWINLLKIDDKIYKQSVKQLISFFTKHQIQVRPVWFLNHLQKPYKNSQSYKITNAKKLINKILCLPSSSNLKKSQIQNIFYLLKKKLKFR